MSAANQEPTDPWAGVRSEVSSGRNPFGKEMAAALRATGGVVPTELLETVAGALDGTRKRKRGEKRRPSVSDRARANFSILIRLRNMQAGAVAHGIKGARKLAEEVLAEDMGISVSQLKRRIGQLNSLAANPPASWKAADVEQLRRVLTALKSDEVIEFNAERFRKELQSEAVEEA